MFTLRGGTWSQTAELAASDGATGDSFGWGVTLSAPGSTALIGATGRNTIAGAAYVFTLQGGTWSQTAELAASDAAPSDQLGSSVALSAWAARPWPVRPGITHTPGPPTCSPWAGRA